MPFCNSCGTQLPDNAKFCNECGEAVTNQNNTNSFKVNVTLTATPDISTKEHPSHVSKIRVPSNKISNSIDNYAVVASIFSRAGFQNIQTVPLRDLTLGLLKKPGTVDSITINGKELSSYFIKKFYPDAHIVITYHSIR